MGWRSERSSEELGRGDCIVCWFPARGCAFPLLSHDLSLPRASTKTHPRTLARCYLKASTAAEAGRSSRTVSALSGRQFRRSGATRPQHTLAVRARRARFWTHARPCTSPHTGGSPARRHRTRDSCPKRMRAAGDRRSTTPCLRPSQKQPLSVGQFKGTICVPASKNGRRCEVVQR